MMITSNLFFVILNTFTIPLFVGETGCLCIQQFITIIRKIVKDEETKGGKGKKEGKSNQIFPVIYMGCIRYASTNKPP